MQVLGIGPSILLVVMGLESGSFDPVAFFATISTPRDFALLAFVLGLPLLAWAVGQKIKQRQEWARWSGIALSCLALLLVPVGTVLGGVAIYYLTVRWYERS